jgi:TonB family protein
MNKTKKIKKMKRVKIFILLVMLLTVETSSAQLIMTWKVDKMARTGEQWFHVTTNIVYHQQYPELQKALSRLLFGKDYANTKLKDGFEQYMNNTYDEVIAPNGIDQTLGQKETMTVVFLGGERDKYLNYKVVYQKLYNEGNEMVERTRERHIIYDIAQRKILTMADIFQPDMITSIKENLKMGKATPQMELNDKGITIGVMKNGKFQGSQYKFKNLGDKVFTNQFKQMIGYANIMKADSIQAAMKREQRILTPHSESSSELHIFDVVEQMPEFPGGQAALLKWISDHIKYPTIAEENGIQGHVICTFVVECDGSITDVRVSRSIDPSLDKEALRVLGLMPKWRPGRQKGKAVRVKYTVPVGFRLM